MTDLSIDSGHTSLHTTDAARKRLRARYARESRFKWMGMSAVLIAVAFLIILLSTIVMQAWPAFTYHYAVLPVDLSAANVDPADPDAANYDGIAKDAISARFPSFQSRQEKRTVRGLLSGMSGRSLEAAVADDPSMLGTDTNFAFPLDDFADLYVKGLLAEERTEIDFAGRLVPSANEGDDVTLSGDVGALYDAVAANGALRREDDGSIRLRSADPSYLIKSGGGVIKLTGIAPRSAEGSVLIPLDETAGTSSIEVLESPESQRKISDREIVLLDALAADGAIERRMNTTFFFTGASREPEQAGIWGAVVGSALTMLVTLAMSFPLGVGAAIYLEEFAPKNRLTQIIEVNINNLAAVPSIVFGLLGLAVFINWFSLPRSAALVGGMVLALMTLPTIIIASRAALRAVPPSIREAAMGVGASPVQTVFHHVLPLAMPGILTGTIIGMAQALGETAPLLMIGMVAFIVDIPGGFTDPATVLPVQIYMWADFPEPAFQQKTSAAILILLGFLVLMNTLAVFLRKRFERRW